MNLPDIASLLTYRLYLSIIILIPITIRIWVLFASRRNGIVKAMAIENLIIAAYLVMVVLVSVVDVVQLPDLRRRTLLTMNVIHVMWIVAILWSFWRFLKGD